MNDDNLLKKTSIYLASESKGDPEVLFFGLRLLLTSVSGYAALIILSLLFGLFPYSLTAAISHSIFRVFSGGAHASSPLRCISISTATFLLIGTITKLYWPATVDLIVFLPIAVTLIGMYIVYKFAPADTPGKPISSQIQKTYLRVISFVLLLGWCLGTTTILVFNGVTDTENSLIFASILGVLWQLVTISPLGYAIVGTADSAVRTIMERRL